MNWTLTFEDLTSWPLVIAKLARLVTSFVQKACLILWGGQMLGWWACWDFSTLRRKAVQWATSNRDESGHPTRIHDKKNEWAVDINGIDTCPLLVTLAVACCVVNQSQLAVSGLICPKQPTLPTFVGSFQHRWADWFTFAGCVCPGTVPRTMPGSLKSSQRDAGHPSCRNRTYWWSHKFTKIAFHSPFECDDVAPNLGDDWTNVCACSHCWP